MSRRWVRLAQALTALLVGVAVWLIAVNPSGDPNVTAPSASEAPLVTVMPEFTLDAEVVGSADVGLLYVLEHRARPNYRILQLDTATGNTVDVFAVPDRAIVYATAADPSGRWIALAYTEDFSLGSNGIYLVDLEQPNPSPTPLVVEEPAVFFTDLVWDETGNELWTTRVDRTGEGASGESELLSVQSFAVDSGIPGTTVNDAVDPAVGDGWIAYLPLESDGSRRVIAVQDDEGNLLARHDPFDLGHDLDHLLYDASSGRLIVSAILLDGQATISLGSPAGAHGNHDKPAQLFSVDPMSGEPAGPHTRDATIIYDTTALADGSLAYVTREGLSVLGRLPIELANEPVESTPLLKSRALRMITN